LEADYPLVQIISRAPENDPPVRFWYGTENNPRGPSGEVGSVSLRTIASKISFPTIGFINPEWTHPDAWSDLDLFMSYQSSAYRLIGKDKIDGREALLLECVTFSAPGKFGRTTKAWIDPRRGFLPIRLEYLVLNPDGTLRFREALTEVSEIQQIGASYYPMRGVRQEFIVDPSVEVERVKRQAAGQAEPKVADLRPTNGWRKTWIVESVKPAAPLDKSAILLAFPIGTVYHNEETGKWSRTGTPQAAYNLEISKEKASRMTFAPLGAEVKPQLSRSSTSLIALGIANVVVLVGLGAGVAYAKRRRKRR
jgi:hypothetical protein